MSENPPPRINTQDGNVQDTSDSDDHFSSASEGTPHPNRFSSEHGSTSPIPIMRVERVDDKPHHGEVPGTSAYEKRLQDAVPDEIEIVPDGTRSRSGTMSRSRSNSTLEGGSGARSPTPGGSPIPKTVVEKVDEEPSYGEVDGTVAKEKRMMDAAPDEVRMAPEVARQSIQGRTEDGNVVEEAEPEDRQAWFRSMWEKEKHEDVKDEEQDDDDNDDGGEPEREEKSTQEDDVSNDADDDDGFGDDFDDFEEGGNNDDDFGDFDDADATPMAPEPTPPAPTSIPTQPPVPSFLAGLPPLDLTSTPASDLQATIDPYLDSIFPSTTSPSQSPSSLPNLSNSTPFLSDRSLSLWQQLVSPPPMAPPNWTRSRIRRLFLVSLGVPVDLDEILPPSKQKRLILPNIDLGNTSSPRPSTGALERLRSNGGGAGNESSTSLDSLSRKDSNVGTPSGAAGKKPSKKHTLPRGPPPPPEFDANSASLVCGTTAEAMARFGDGELREHVGALEGLNRRASLVLEYWLQRKDESLKEKEALEGVIENLVGFVKGRRGK